MISVESICLLNKVQHRAFPYLSESITGNKSSALDSLAKYFETLSWQPFVLKFVLVLNVINVLSAVRVLGALDGMLVLFFCLLYLQVVQLSHPSS